MLMKYGEKLKIDIFAEIQDGGQNHKNHKLENFESVPNNCPGWFHAMNCSRF